MMIRDLMKGIQQRFKEAIDLRLTRRIVILLLLASLAACSADQGEKQTAREKKQSAEQVEKNKNEQRKNDDEKGAAYSVQVNKRTLVFREDELPFQFYIEKNGKPYTDQKIGVQVAVPGGVIPYAAKEIGGGKYRGLIRVPEPGRYQVAIFQMEGHKIHILASFYMNIEKKTQDV